MCNASSVTIQTKIAFVTVTWYPVRLSHPIWSLSIPIPCRSYSNDHKLDREVNLKVVAPAILIQILGPDWIDPTKVANNNITRMYNSIQCPANDTEIVPNSTNGCRVVRAVPIIFVNRIEIFYIITLCLWGIKFDTPAFAFHMALDSQAIGTSNPIGTQEVQSRTVGTLFGSTKAAVLNTGKNLYQPNEQVFVNYENQWPYDQIGIDYGEGRIIDKISEKLITENRELWSPEVSVFSDLLSRGLHPRPGFKYGTLWRCYDQKIGTDHAPWLIVNPSNQTINWENACLASRLASGVNKIWLQPLKINEEWNYLGIIRPPANSRWTNPIKK